jgi:hypothetical protein
MYGIFFFSALYSQTKNDSAYIKFKDTKYNFGFVRQGKVVKIEYYFENTGMAPLLISNIEVTCGCTIADFPHYPVKHGEEGMILLTFNTKEKYDRQDRTVQVISNASNSPTTLRFKGVIIDPKPEKKDSTAVH